MLWILSGVIPKFPLKRFKRATNKKISIFTDLLIYIVVFVGILTFVVDCWLSEGWGLIVPPIIKPMSGGIL